ncbi:MAG: chemotaxis protein CheW [Candidatus Competibacteraceae bacterium]|nr:chemotaxis protein CheW [Candidatus Competibacteraceae bacterium]
MILPNSLVAEVLPFATLLQIETAPRWVAGAMLWRNLTTPLVSLGRLIFRIAPDRDLNSRIIIAHTLGTDPRLPHFGVLSTAAPRPVSVQRTDLDFDLEIPDAERNRPGVLSWATYQDQLVVIPDMDSIEAVLRPLVRRT